MDRNYSKLICLLASLLLCGEICLPPQAFGQDYLRFGRIEVHPGMEVTYLFDDNLFHEANTTFANGTSEGKVSDSKFIFSPSVEISKPRLRGEFFGFEILYQANDKKYLKLTTENDLEHDIRAYLYFSGKAERLKLTLFSSYLDTVSPTSSEFTSNFSARPKRTDIMAKADLEWVIYPRLKANFLGNFHSNKFSADTFKRENSESLEKGFQIIWKVTPLTAIGLKYNFEDIRFTTPLTFGRDSETHSVAAIYRWKPTFFINTELELGYSTRDFQFSDNDEGILTYDGFVTYDYTNRTQFKLSGRRSLLDSSFGDIAAFVSSDFSLAWQQKWGIKINSTVELIYSNLDFSALSADAIDGGGKLKRRNDDSFGFRINGVYNIQKWLKAEIDYSFSTKYSNFNSLEFTSNVLMLSIGVEL